MFTSASSDDKENTPLHGFYELNVKVIEAKELLSKDLNGFSDPYCVVQVETPKALENNKKKTKVVKKSLNPTFDEEFTFHPLYYDCRLSVFVFDQDMLKADEILGVVLIRLSDLFGPTCPALQEEHTVDKWFPLGNSTHKKYKHEKTGGQIHLKIAFKRLQPKKKIVHFEFVDLKMIQTNLSEADQQMYMLPDHTGKYNGILKNLGHSKKDDNIKTDKNEAGARFSGFNYVEVNGNPLRNITDFSISFWFKTIDPSRDFVMISTKTVQMKNAGKKFSGLSIGTKENLLFDINGEPMTSSAAQWMAENADEEWFYDEKMLSELGEDADFDRCSQFKPNAWNHVVIVYTGAFIKEYVNCVLTDVTLATMMPLGHGGKNMQIGARIDGYDVEGFKGSLDSIQMFNYALSFDEVKKLNADYAAFLQ